MSVPFGKFPSLRTYIDHIRKEHNCECREGVFGNAGIYRLSAPDGRYVHIYSLPDGEGLTPTMVSNLDRRLGIKTPFPHAPELDG